MKRRGEAMRCRWIALTAGAILASPVHAVLDDAAAAALMKKDGCAGYHEVDRKLIGPAFRDVAARYRNVPDAAARLRVKVKQGGTHVWGEAAMPPNVAASDEDINELVDWILAQK